MTSTIALLVEDDDAIRARLRPLLQAAGLASIGAHSAAEARSAMKMIFFPVVIVQQLLSDDDGIALCHEIRRREADGRAYILLVSDRDSADEIAKGLAAGADDCIAMRSTDAELLDQLRRAAHQYALPNKP